MHALRRAHTALAPGGALLDVHPVSTDAPVESAGVQLGRLDDVGFADLVRNADARVDELVAEGLLADRHMREQDVLERFDSADEMLEIVGGWEGTRIPEELPPHIRAAMPPIDVRERVVYRLLERR